MGSLETKTGWEAGAWVRQRGLARAEHAPAGEIAHPVNRRRLAGGDRGPDDRRLGGNEALQMAPGPPGAEPCQVRQVAARDERVDVTPVGAIDAHEQQAAPRIERARLRAGGRSGGD